MFFATTHVLVPTDANEPLQTIAKAVGVEALLSQPDQGWVSVLPLEDLDATDAANLSARLGTWPVVWLAGADSDVGWMYLYVAGQRAGALRYSVPSADEPDEPLFDQPEVNGTIDGDLDPWFATLGRGDLDAARAAVSSVRRPGFAEDYIPAIAGVFGIERWATSSARHLDPVIHGDDLDLLVLCNSRT